MARKYKNNASSTLAGALGVSTTTLTVATGQGDRFPVASGADYFKLTLQKSGGTEIVKVTSRAASSDSMTIVRAQEGTTALSFSIGDTVSLRATADSYDSIDAHIEATSAAHSASAIANIPSGGISATNVQAALNELDAEKEPAGAVAAHVAAADPHPQYLTAAELSAGAYQPAHVNLTAESNLVGAANKLPYYTGVGAKALTDLTAFSRTLLDDADATTARSTLGAQATLVSGTNIKTVAGQSLLGSGDVTISSIGRLYNIVRITTAGTGTYNKPSNVNRLLIRAIGGGGGGGSNGGGAGGGGGGGGYGELWITSPASSYSYTVGAGGTGGISNGNGTNGGATTIAGISAGGGGYGSSVSASNGTGGSGGTTTGGNVNVRGSPGISGDSNGLGGTGGMSPMFGGNGIGGNNSAGGSGVFGGGGGGGGSTITLYSGGTGGNGYIEIWEFE
jgi:hypothetical protein